MASTSQLMQWVCDKAQTTLCRELGQQALRRAALLGQASALRTRSAAPSPCPGSPCSCLHHKSHQPPVRCPEASIPASMAESDVELVSRRAGSLAHPSTRYPHGRLSRRQHVQARRERTIASGSCKASVSDAEQQRRRSRRARACRAAWLGMCSGHTLPRL